MNKHPSQRFRIIYQMLIRGYCQVLPSDDDDDDDDR